MDELLTIRNFGPIKEVELIIKPNMVFIGPQSSGKSTIAKLLSIFRDTDFVIKNDGFLRFFEENNIANYFQGNETYFSFKNDNYSIIYENDQWILSRTESFEIEIEKETQRIRKFLEGILEERFKNDAPQQREKVIKQIYDMNWKALFLLLNKQIYIPAERILTSIISESGFSFNEVSLPGALKQFGRQYETSRIRKNKGNIPFLNIEYKSEEKKGLRIYYDKTHSIGLNESSSGVQALLPLHLVIESLSVDGSKYSFIVEEPELNLFPTTQKEVINFLVDKTNHRNELIITTHSPYVLTVLNNLLFAYIVATKNENNLTEVNKFIPESIWINPDNFIAYYLADGKATSLINEKTKLIHDNALDSISQDIIGERDKLIELYKLSR